MDILVVKPGTHDLRPRFLVSTVPGSHRVFGCVADRPCHCSVKMVGSSFVAMSSDASALLTVTIAGVHKHFPDWENPLKTDEERERSTAFWRKEWADE
jgi:hypothetical protein